MRALALLFDDLAGANQDDEQAAAGAGLIQATSIRYAAGLSPGPCRGR